MADLNEQNDFNDTLTNSDSNDFLIFEDSDTTPLLNLEDFAADQGENYLFDIESGSIYTEDPLGSSTDDLTVGYSGYSYVVDVWGTPIADGDYWRQQDGDYACAVVAQISIYESITGVEIPEATAAEYAEDRGWFDPAEGTEITYSGSILEVLGVETTQSDDNNIYDIINALNDGDKIIAALDANEIWTPLENSITGEPIEQPGINGHVVWVTGVQQNSDSTVDFVLNDSGDPYGQQSLVDSRDFINAWGDYNYFLSIAEA